MGDISQVNPGDFSQVIKAGQASAKKRKEAVRTQIGDAYQNMMGTMQSPQDHPANNLQHPHGNRGIDDSTISMSTPLNTPNTGAYAEDY